MIPQHELAAKVSAGNKLRQTLLAPTRSVASSGLSILPILKEMRHLREALLAAIIFAAILISLGAIAYSYNLIVYWLPLVNSVALLSTTPKASAAQSWPIIAGHGITACIGTAFGQLFGTTILLAAVAAGVGIFAMVLLRAIHPPAAATALLFSLHPPNDWTAARLLVIGAITLAGMGTVARQYGFCLMKKKTGEDLTKVKPRA